MSKSSSPSSLPGSELRFLNQTAKMSRSSFEVSWWKENTNRKRKSSMQKRRESHNIKIPLVHNGEELNTTGKLREKTLWSDSFLARLDLLFFLFALFTIWNSSPIYGLVLFFCTKMSSDPRPLLLWNSDSRRLLLADSSSVCLLLADSNSCVHDMFIIFFWSFFYVWSKKFWRERVYVFV